MAVNSCFKSTLNLFFYFKTGFSFVLILVQVCSLSCWVLLHQTPEAQKFMTSWSYASGLHNSNFIHCILLLELCELQPTSTVTASSVTRYLTKPSRTQSFGILLQVVANLLTFRCHLHNSKTINSPSLTQLYLFSQNLTALIPPDENENLGLPKIPISLKEITVFMYETRYTYIGLAHGTLEGIHFITL